jgi:surface protein
VDSRSLFSAQTELRTIDVAMLDVSQVENMNGLFYICQHLSEMKGIEEWDVSHVKHMSSMFYYCFGLRNLDQLKKWDVSSVKDTAHMFYSCGNLENVDGVTGWNMVNAENMTEMFRGCFALPAPPTWYITWTKKFLGVDLEKEWEYRPNLYKSLDTE